MNDFLLSQDKFVKQVSSSKKSNRFSHALLIESSSNFTLNKAINYVIATILCELDTPCFECDYCHKAINNTYSDLMIFDLTDESLKKDNVLEIQKRFSKTGLEINNKQIYVIKNIEMASNVTLNALLKFLEEPSNNVYAIFTTKNIDKILPTIVSRSSCYRLVQNDISKIKDIYYKKYSHNDVDLVALISKDEMLIENILNKEVFSLYKTSISSLLSSLYSNKFFLRSHELLDDLEKEDLRIFFELIYISVINLELLLNYGVSEEIIERIKNSSKYDEILDVILSSRLRLDTNMNKLLIIDSFAIEIEEARE